MSGDGWWYVEWTEGGGWRVLLHNRGGPLRLRPPSSRTLSLNIQGDLTRWETVRTPAIAPSTQSARVFSVVERSRCIGACLAAEALGGLSPSPRDGLKLRNRCARRPRRRSRPFSGRASWSTLLPVPRQRSPRLSRRVLSFRSARKKSASPQKAASLPSCVSSASVQSMTREHVGGERVGASVSGVETMVTNESHAGTQG